MRYILVIVSALIVFVATNAPDANAQCAQPITITAGTSVTAPANCDTASLVDTRSGSSQGVTVTGGKFVADPVAFPLLQAVAQGSADATKLVLRWTSSTNAGITCDQPVTIDLTSGGGNAGGNNSQAPSDAAIYQTCENEVSAKSDRIKKLVGTEAYDAGRYTVVVLHPEIGLCYASRQFGVQGEPIVTGILTDSTYQLPRLKLDPCSARPSGPRVFAPSGGIKAPGVQASSLELILPRADVCYDDSVTITLSSTKASEDISVNHALKQYPRYHATLQLAAMFTDNQQRTFGWRPGENNSNVITDEGPVDEGPEYYASLMIYGAPRYLVDLFRGQRYDGRELTTERSWKDRTSLVLGAGLSKPAERLGAGLSYEILPGLNIVGMYERAKISHLNGVNVGDAFTGAKEAIPMKKSWDEQIVFGFGIDGRYALGIFTGK